ncbi:MAG: MFS transporter [Streptomycetaceae bacterium]|nr:MFS transporter [Streptomycetaceae bacterium]
MSPAHPAAPEAVDVGPATGRHPAIWALLIGTLLTRAAGFAYPMLAFHASSSGLSDRMVGLVLAVFGLGWLLGQVWSGWLTDVLGYRTVLGLALLVAAVELPLLALAHDPVALAAASLCAGAVLDATRPAVSTAIADLVPDEKRRAVVNGWRLGCINLGAAAAAAIGGLLYEPVGYGVLCWINALALAGFAAVAVPLVGTGVRTARLRKRLHTCPRSRLGHSPRGRSGDGLGRPHTRTALADRALWLLCAASVCSMTCAVALVTTLPMMMTADGLAGSAYGWTQVVHTAGVVALTPLLTPFVSGRAGRPAGLLRIQAASSVALAAGMGAAGFADATWAYGVAVLVAVPGEVAWYVAAGEMVDVIAPARARGTYHGLWGTCFAASAIVAPLVTGWALDVGGGPSAGAVILLCGLAGALLCMPLHRAVRRTRPEVPRQPDVDPSTAEAARLAEPPHTARSL